MSRAAHVSAQRALVGLVGLIVVVVDFVWLKYPYDNDLKGLGWLITQIPRAPVRSLANEAYPFGFHGLLFLMQTVRGDLIGNAFAVEILAFLGVLLVSRRVVSRLTEQDVFSEWLVLVVLVLGGLRVATSEYADGPATLFAVVGAQMILARSGDAGTNLRAGLAFGVSWWFRHHYLAFAAVVPAALVLSGAGHLAARLRAAAMFVAGFVVGGAPTMALNLLAHGTPVYTGYSRYFPGKYAMGWNDADFLGTYDRWPLRRLIAEEPLALVRLVGRNLGGLIISRTVLVAMLLMGVGLAWGLGTREPVRRRAVWLCLTICGLYLLVVVLPTVVTFRALWPVWVLASWGLALVAPDMMRWVKLQHGTAVAAVATALLVVVTGYTSVFGEWIARHARYRENREVSDWLVGQGIVDPVDVLTNRFDLYPLFDPRLVTFHGYGGWLQLNPVFARERPSPFNFVGTADSWAAFATRHGKRIIIVGREAKTEPLFQRTELDGDWALCREFRTLRAFCRR